jgi:hypothetical protein
LDDIKVRFWFFFIGIHLKIKGLQAREVKLASGADSFWDVILLGAPIDMEGSMREG